MSDSITLELSLSDRIFRLGERSTPLEIEDTLKIIANSPPIEQAQALRRLSKRTKIGTNALKTAIKPFIKQQKIETRRIEIAASDESYGQMTQLIVIPINSNGQAERMGSYLIVKAKKEHYLTPFYTASNYASPATVRELREKLLANSKAKGFDQLVDGNPDKAMDAEIESMRKRLETDVQKGRIGIECKASFGPILKDATFHTITDYKKGVLILRGWGMSGAEIVRTAPQPEERPDAFARFCRICGPNWQTALAHILACLVNESPTGKHALYIWGSVRSGKSSVARWLSALIDGNPVNLTAAGLSGNWPKYFSARSPIVGNIDNGSLDTKDFDVIAESITERSVTVHQRYTPSGLTGEGGYPIFTSKQPDVFGRDGGMMRRLVTINQNEDLEIKDLTTPESKVDTILSEFRPHLWWQLQQFATAIVRDELPSTPGGLSQTNFARARWWVATAVESLSEGEAETVCETYQIVTDEEMEWTPFTRGIDIALSKVADFPITMRAKEIYDLMATHCYDLLTRIPCGKSNLAENPNAMQSMAKMINSKRIGNRIGPWVFLDHKDNKGKHVYYVSKLEVKMPANADLVQDSEGEAYELPF